MDHLAGADRVWLAARHHDHEEADRLGRLVSEELLFVIDDLGWGDTRGEPVVLTSPPDLVRRVVVSLRDMASAEGGDERKSPEATRAAEREGRQVRRVCDRLLDALGGPGKSLGG